MDFGTNSGKILRKGADAQTLLQEVAFPQKNALASEIDDFVKTVLKTRESGVLCDTRVPGEQGLRALSLAIAICDEIAANNRKYGC